MTKPNKYKLTAAEKRLLEVLINPDYVGYSVTDICSLANVGRNKYYDAMAKEEFRDIVNSTTLDIIKGKASDVLNATYKYALTEKGHQDRKLILTMAGIYADKQVTELTGSLDLSTQALEIDEYLNGSD